MGSSDAEALASSDEEIAESEDSDSDTVVKRFGRKRRVVLGVLVVAAVACLVVGIVLFSMDMNYRRKHLHVGYAWGPRFGGGGDDGEFITNREAQTYPWAEPVRSVEEAFGDAFPDGSGWTDIRFQEGRVPVVDRPLLIAWVQQELLGGADPFAKHGGEVPVPLSGETTSPLGAPPEKVEPGDQVGPGGYVGYSRRQVCYIAAKSLIGAATDGYENGLLRLLNEPGHADFQQAGVPGNESGCLPRKGGFGRSLFVLLAACVADPRLENGQQGPLLVAARAAVAREVSDLRTKASSFVSNLAGAGLRICQYGDGVEQVIAKGDDGLHPVPPEGCRPPGPNGPGRDFMTGGLPGQATQDISAAFVGGYVYGNACGLGGGQDERLMVYMPEVMVLSFFLSQGSARPQLRQPAWVLGARMLYLGLDGTARWNTRLEVDPATPFTRDLVHVNIAGQMFDVSASRPFLAFMSWNRNFLGDPEPGTEVREARVNKQPLQRAVDASAWYSFQHQVLAWYTAVSIESYASDVRPALGAIVKSLGVGPWGAGLWWGDSQMAFLAAWIGHSLAAPSWNNESYGRPQVFGDIPPPALPLDYYIYSTFTENPGNQCFVHAGEHCVACQEKCAADPLPSSAFWLPDYAYMPELGNPLMNESCAINHVSCGDYGLVDVVKSYHGAFADYLWNNLEEALLADPSVTHSVFDLLMVRTNQLAGTG